MLKGSVNLKEGRGGGRGIESKNNQITHVNTTSKKIEIQNVVANVTTHTKQNKYLYTRLKICLNNLLNMFK